ncbi:MAG TPA: cell wall hydrolase [Pseudolabrys sp.]|jgi:spore germination cell wall hydrolase CwlJ-like protein
MAVLCGRRRRRFAPIGIGALVLALLPNTVAHQDLGALLVRQPGVAMRAREHLIASPFGTIHAAMFSLPRPIGTGIPHPPIYALANFDPTEITGSIASQYLGDPNSPLQFPTVNRRTKRDSLLARSREPLPPMPPLVTVDPVVQADADAPAKNAEAGGRFEPYSEYEFASVSDEQMASPDLPSSGDASGHRTVKDGTRVYFGTDPLAAEQPLTPWAPGEAPVVLASRESSDPDIKQSALAAPGQNGEGNAGETIASKGEVTGVDARPKSPAERLGLSGPVRVKEEKCLADAVYFEARGESVRGQIAVAQVVLNRVFSPFYPNTVCGAVYQNSNRHLACQFTFACDGIPDVVTEPDAWLRAKRIARDMLDGKLWMPEVAKATHYHAYWVHPDWVNEMKKIYKLGVHTFYRPLNWGDGSDEPTWGDAKLTQAEVAKEEQEGPPVSHSKEWLQSDEGKAYTRQNARQ